MRLKWKLNNVSSRFLGELKFQARFGALARQGYASDELSAEEVVMSSISLPGDRRASKLVIRRGVGQVVGRCIMYGEEGVLKRNSVREERRVSALRERACNIEECS